MTLRSNIYKQSRSTKSWRRTNICHINYGVHSWYQNVLKDDNYTVSNSDMAWVTGIHKVILWIFILSLRNYSSIECTILRLGKKKIPRQHYTTTSKQKFSWRVLQRHKSFCGMWHVYHGETRTVLLLYGSRFDTGLINVWIRHLFATHKTDWAMGDQAKKSLNSTARPYDEWAFSPLDITAVWPWHLVLVIYIFGVVNLDALAQASDIRI